MSAVLQRPLRGSRISTFYPVKNLPSLSSLNSAFQLQEYISLLIRLDVHDVEAITSLPGVPSTDKNENKAKDGASEQEGGDAASTSAGGDGVSAGAAAAGDNTEGGASESKGRGSSGASAAEATVDEACWIYEQIRRLAQDLSHPLITTLQQECTRSTCPEMKAGEWLYLCVAHGNDGSMEHCCAIDYILHTVDSATALLNSPRTFPSRLQIPPASNRHFSALARRLGRIFAHAYFHHREAFEQAEAESSLYARFLALTSKFDLVPAEFLVIPPTHASDDHHNSNDPPRNLVGGGVPERFGLGYPPPPGQHPAGLPSVGLPMTHGHTGSDDGDYSRNIPHLHHRGGLPQGLPKAGGMQHHHPHQQPHHQQHPLATQHQPPPPLSRDVGGGGGAPGGIGESPAPPGSRSRLGRNRTDTMVFNEEEAAIFAEQLRSPAGGSKGVDAPSDTPASGSGSTSDATGAASATDGGSGDVPSLEGVEAPVDASETSASATGPVSTSAETINLPEQDAGALGPVEDMSLEGDEDEEDDEEDEEEEDEDDGIEPVEGEDEEDVSGHGVHDSAPIPSASEEGADKEGTAQEEPVDEKKEAPETSPPEETPEKEAVEETPAPPVLEAEKAEEVEVVAEVKPDEPSVPSTSDSTPTDATDADTKEDAPAKDEQTQPLEDLKSSTSDHVDVVEPEPSSSSGGAVDPSDVPLPAAVEGELVQPSVVGAVPSEGDESISIGMTSVEEVEEFLRDDSLDEEEDGEVKEKATGKEKEAEKEGKKEVEV